MAFRHEGVPFVLQLVAGQWLGLSRRQLVRLELGAGSTASGTGRDVLVLRWHKSLS